MNNTNISGLNIDSSLTPTNQDIVVTFSPNANIINYKYRIFKNSGENLTTNKGELINPSVIYNDYVTVNSSMPININLNETGVYKLEIITTDYNGNIQVINSGNYVIDKELPKINIADYNNQIIEYKIGESSIDIFDGVTVLDNYDGDLLNSLVTNYDELDFKKEGIKELTYTVSDQAGNMAFETIKINAIKSDLGFVHFSQVMIVLILIPIIGYLFIYNRSIRLERRLNKYSIEPIKKYSFCNSTWFRQ